MFVSGDKQCISMIIQLFWLIDLGLDSNFVFGHLIACVSRHVGHAAFQTSEDCSHFFSLPPPSSPPFLFLRPTFLHFFGVLFVALLFHSATSASCCIPQLHTVQTLIVFSSSTLPLLSFLSPLPPVPFIFRHHQLGFSA